MPLPDPFPALAQAEALYRRGALAEAASVLAPLAYGPPEHGPREHAWALSLLGLCELRLGDAPGGLLRLARAHGLAPDQPLIALRYGIGLQANRRHAEAAACFRACCAALPDDPAPAVNLASALLDLGDPAGAVAAARVACARDPGLAAGHYTLGRALLAAGALTGLGLPGGAIGGAIGEAVGCLRTALALAPDLVDGWIELGRAEYRAGALAPAIAALRRAIALAPGHRGAIASLAALLRLAGEVDEAEILLTTSLAADPDAPEPRLARASVALQDEAPAEALALLSGPPPAAPELVAPWGLARVLALLQANDPAAARSELAALGDPPPGLAVAHAWRHILLARAEGDEARAEAAADAMEALLAEPRVMLPEHRIMAHFDLAKFRAERGQTARAFAGWTAGHRALAPFQPFSRDAWRGFVEASRAAFDRRSADAPRASNRDPAPVFIVGMPRSGTTLLEQILAAHPRVHAAGERGALGQAFRNLGGGAEDATAVARVAARTPPELDRAARAYLAALHALAPEAGRIVDKMPGNFARLGLVARLLPGARILHCTRDPRDTGLSIFTYRFYGYHPYAHDLADLGWYIGQYARLMAHWTAALPMPILTVRLADWVEDFRATLLRVLAFLDLPYDPRCERFWEVKRRIRTVSRAQVARPVNASGLGRWKPYEAFLGPLLGELRAAGLIDGED